MKFTNENALLASLMGSKVIKQVPRFEAIQNEIGKHVLGSVNILPFQNQESNIISSENYEDFDLWMNDKVITPENQFFPLSFYSLDEKTKWTLPWEPLISVSARNIIKERYVAKGSSNYIGSVKERWSQDDYEITITGAFYGEKMMGTYEECYPRTDMEKLRALLMRRSAIRIECELLQLLNIYKICIYSVDFPFTKGENVQAYEIKAKSDFPYSLIYQPQKAKLEVGNPEGEYIR